MCIGLLQLYIYNKEVNLKTCAGTIWMRGDIMCTTKQSDLKRKDPAKLQQCLIIESTTSLVKNIVKRCRIDVCDYVGIQITEAMSVGESYHIG